MKKTTMEELTKARAELSEAYDRLYEEILRLDVVHDLVGDALARVKALQWKLGMRNEELGMGEE